MSTARPLPAELIGPDLCQEITALRERFRGFLLQKGDDGSDRVRQIWNAVFDRRQMPPRSAAATWNAC